MLYSIIILYVTMIGVIIFLSILAYNVYSPKNLTKPDNQIPDTTPPPDTLPPPGNGNGNGTTMKTDSINTMGDTGRVVMDISYMPLDDNDIVTKKYTNLIFSNIVSSKKLLTLDGNNQMDYSGSITMHNTYVPVNDNDIVTKKYIDNNISLPEASDTVKGIIQLSGDLSGTADAPVIAPNILTLDKFADTIPNTLLGSNISGKLVNYNLSSGLVLNNSTIELNNVIKTINGISPDQYGNVSLIINTVHYGDLIILDTLDVNPGELFIVINDIDPLNNGRLFIFTENGWIEIIPSMPILDTKYLRFDKQNVLTNGSGIKMSTDYTPIDDKDIVTKEYVDDVVVSSNIPDATDLNKGIIQLSGDLSGSANLPIIADNAITKEKMAQLSNTNIILGSNEIDTNVSELSLESHFSITNNILSYTEIKKFKKYYYAYASSLPINEGDGVYTYNSSGPSSITISTSDNGLIVSQNYPSAIISISTSKITTKDIYMKFVFNIQGMDTPDAIFKFRLYNEIINDYELPIGSINTTSNKIPSDSNNILVIVKLPPMTTDTVYKVQLRSFYQSVPDIVFSPEYYRTCYIEEI